MTRSAGDRSARLVCLATVFFLARSEAGAFASDAESASSALAAGPVLVRVEPHRSGMRIDFDGIPVSLHSELVVTTPPWTPHFYVGPTAETLAAARRERGAFGERLTLLHRGQGAFEGTETLTLSPEGRTLEQRFEGRFLRDGEALIQWRMAALDADLFAGRSSMITRRPDDGRSQPGRLPIEAQPEGSPAARIARGFSRLQVDSRLGRIEIEIESDRPLEVVDYRASKWVAPGSGYFWFGDMGSRIRKDNPARYRVVYRFPPAPAPQPPDRELRVRVGISAEVDVRTTRTAEPPSLLPTPKSATWGADEVSVPVAGQAFAEGDVPPGIRAALRSMLIGAAGEGPRPLDHGRPIALIYDSRVADGRPEGYSVEVGSHGVRLRASDSAGFLHAIRTLRQLVRVSADGGLRARVCRIVDWPTLRFRGVHLFTGGRGPDLHLRLLRNVIGALKFNHLVLEAEYVRWDGFPEIHHPQYGMSKDDVRRILEVCRAEQIDVTPLINTLGHCQWMFETGHHLELCEDPEARWAYCVTNDKTYDFIFRIFDEALALFKPRFLHIGHDEFTDRGRVPFRESSKPFSVDELFMRDTLRLHAWLQQRGVRVMMWGDMLLAPGEAPDASNAKSVEEAAKLRSRLPDDVLITDWHYAGVSADRFTNLRLWREAGHDVVAAAWNRPDNIFHFARAAAEAGTLGLLQTTWAGYSLDEESFKREQAQYAAYVLAGEAAWNAERAAALDLTTAQRRFRECMGLTPLPPRNARGRTVDLSKAFNYATVARTEGDWFGQGPRNDLSRVPTGNVWLDRAYFALGTPPGASVIALHGKLAADAALPSRVRVDLPDLRCRTLLVLHATNFRAAPGTLVGRYEIELADGSTRSLDLRYGENIRACSDPAPSDQTAIVWTGTTASGAPLALAVLPWSPADIDQPIRRWTMRSAHAGPSVLVFAATAVTE